MKYVCFVWSLLAPSRALSVVFITTTTPIFQNHLEGNMCQGGVAGGVIIGPRPSYGPEGGDKVELIEPEQKFPTRILKTCGEK